MTSSFQREALPLPSRALSFEPRHAPRVTVQQLSILPHLCISLAQVHWKPGLGAGSGAGRLVPPWPRAMSKHGLWVFLFFAGNEGTVEDHPPLSPEALIVAPSLFVALLVQVFCSTEEMPGDINVLWRRWQKRALSHQPQKVFHPSLSVSPCRWTLDRVSLQDLSFALHTGLCAVSESTALLSVA